MSTAEQLSIPMCPVPIRYDGTPFTPALARFFERGELERLVSITPPGETKRMEFLTQDLSAISRVEEWTTDYWGVKVARTDGTCVSVCVFTEVDATDPFFSNLPAGDRQSIFATVRGAA